MTALLNLAARARAAKLAVIAAALAIGIAAFAVPAVTEAAEPAQGWLAEPRPHRPWYGDIRDPIIFGPLGWAFMALDSMDAGQAQAGEDFLDDDCRQSFPLIYGVWPWQDPWLFMQVCGH